MTHSNRSGESRAEAGVRLDTWLWAARFFRTRTLAKQAVETGRIEVVGQSCKPAHPLRAGSVLKIARGEERFEIEVLHLSDRRGSASAAQTLYRESEISRAARETAREQRRAERAGYQPPAGKPDKRARRLIRALGDIDAI
ncbi:MAG: RNA-binding S4 domain-containing protein [Rhodanobacteraceae bacterium]